MPASPIRSIVAGLLVGMVAALLLVLPWPLLAGAGRSDGQQAGPTPPPSVAAVTSPSDPVATRTPSTTAGPAPTTTTTPAGAALLIPEAPEDSATAAAEEIAWMRAQAGWEGSVLRTRFFSTLLPRGYAVRELDRDVGYGLRTVLADGSGHEIVIDTSEWTGSVEASARSLASGVGSRLRREPHRRRVGDREVWLFGFESVDGVDRVDILFDVGPRGFAVLVDGREPDGDDPWLPDALVAAMSVEGVERRVDLGDPSTFVPMLGVRGTAVAVPAGWEAHFVDAGGSGSWSVWIDPADPQSFVYVRTGVSLGDWYEIDGVPGSVDPSGIIRSWGADLEVVELDERTYRFEGPVQDDPRLVGVWAAEFLEDTGEVCCFRLLVVRFPAGVPDGSFDAIVDYFLSHLPGR